MLASEPHDQPVKQPPSPKQATRTAPQLPDTSKSIVVQHVRQVQQQTITKVQIPPEHIGAPFQQIIPSIRESKEPTTRSVSGSPVLGTSSIPIHKLPAKKRYLRLLRDKNFVSLLSTSQASSGTSGSSLDVQPRSNTGNSSSSSSCAIISDQGAAIESKCVVSTQSSTEDVIRRVKNSSLDEVSPNASCLLKSKSVDHDAESPDVDILGTSPSQAPAQQHAQPAQPIATQQPNAASIPKQKSPSTSSSSVSSADELASTGSTSGAQSAESTNGSSPSRPSSQQVSPNSTSSAFSENSLNSQKRAGLPSDSTSQVNLRVVPKSIASKPSLKSQSPPQVSCGRAVAAPVTKPLTVNTNVASGRGGARTPRLGSDVASCCGQLSSRTSPYVRVSPKGGCAASKSPPLTTSALLAAGSSAKSSPSDSAASSIAALQGCSNAQALPVTSGLPTTTPTPLQRPLTPATSVAPTIAASVAAAAATAVAQQINPLVLLHQQQAAAQTLAQQSSLPQVNYSQLAATAVADMQAQTMINAVYAQEQRRQQVAQQQQQLQQMAALTMLQQAAGAAAGGPATAAQLLALQQAAQQAKYQSPHTSKSSTSSIYFPQVAPYPFNINNMNSTQYPLLLNPDTTTTKPAIPSVPSRTPPTSRTCSAQRLTPPAQQRPASQPAQKPVTPVTQGSHATRAEPMMTTDTPIVPIPQATPLTSLTVPQIRPLANIGQSKSASMATGCHRVPSSGDSDGAFVKPLDPSRPLSPRARPSHPMEALTKLTQKQPLTALLPRTSTMPRKSDISGRRASSSTCATTQTTPKKQSAHSSQTASLAAASSSTDRYIEAPAVLLPPPVARQPIPKVKIQLDKTQLPGSSDGGAGSSTAVAGALSSLMMTGGLKKSQQPPRKKHQKKTKHDVLRAELKAQRKAVAAEGERTREAASPELSTTPIEPTPLPPKSPQVKVNKRKSAPQQAPVPTASVDDKAQPTNKRRRRHNSCNVTDANKITGIKKVVTTEHRVDYQIEQDDDSYSSITCFCREPFNGRLMVECEICGIWYHADCVKLSKDSIPDVFICSQKKKCLRKKQQATTTASASNK